MVKLPSRKNAQVSPDKIRRYLLSETHAEGRSKARFFLGLGFSEGEWEVFAEALRRHAAELEVSAIEDSPFGARFVIECNIETPTEKRPCIRSVWFIETGDSVARFVTAYPLKRWLP